MTTRVKPVLAFPPLGRRRRPSGEPPPLPRRIDSTSRLYVALAAVTALLWAGLSFRPALSVITKADLAVIRAVAHLRSAPVTTMMRTLTALGSGWTVGTVAAATIVVLVAFRRARHLIAFVAIGLADVLLLSIAVQAIGRMRPAGVDI